MEVNTGKSVLYGAYILTRKTNVFRKLSAMKKYRPIILFLCTVCREDSCDMTFDNWVRAIKVVMRKPQGRKQPGTITRQKG